GPLPDQCDDEHLQPRDLLDAVGGSWTRCCNGVKLGVRRTDDMCWVGYSWSGLNSKSECRGRRGSTTSQGSGRTTSAGGNTSWIGISVIGRDTCLLRSSRRE